MTPDPVALRVAIADDEPLARARLRYLLDKVAGDGVVISFEAADVNALLDAAAETPVDLLFLDIEMPGGGGFSALRRWPGPRPHVVFVTAYQEHGVKAFDTRALDYLLKPVVAARLQETLNRAKDALRAQRQQREPQQSRQHIQLMIGRRRHLVPVEEIDLVVARGNYLELHADGRKFVLLRALHEFHASLNSTEFIRVHRSAVIRRAAIQSIKAAGSGRYFLGLRNGIELCTGRSYRAVARTLLD